MVPVHGSGNVLAFVVDVVVQERPVQVMKTLGCLVDHEGTHRPASWAQMGA